TIHRRADYNKGVSLDILLQHLGGVFANPLPPGVTMVASKSKTLLGTGNKGHIVLQAAPNAAPIEEVPICVLAHVSINFVVKVSYSSPALLLSVDAKPLPPPPSPKRRGGAALLLPPLRFGEGGWGGGVVFHHPK